MPLKDEQIEKYLNRLADLIQDFKGGPFIKIEILAIGKTKRSPFPIMGGELESDDLNNQLKNAAQNDLNDYDWLTKKRVRIIKKGTVETAWARGSQCVIVCGFEELVINESLNDFCQRMGWNFD